MPETTPPLFLPVSGVYGGRDLALPYRDIVGEGVLGYTDMRVTQRGAGANMSVDVATGVAWIMGDASATTQGHHRCTNIGPTNVPIATASGSNPRLDMIVAEILDHGLDGSGQVLWRLRSVAGTATGGATLDNRTGAAALPSSAILLADVLVATSDTSIIDAEIRDRRPIGSRGIVPWPLQKFDTSPLEFPPWAYVPSTGASTAVGFTFAVHDEMQAACMAFLPRRIVAATRIKWKYQVDTAVTGNGYVIGIYDASGRKIIDTGTVAVVGATDSVQVRSETIAATTFEAGWYYVMIGVDITAGTLGYRGADLQITTTGSSAFSAYPNAILHNATGGITAPATLLGYSDAHVATANLARPGVPTIALSVG